jgi:hypothetical protein
VWPNCNDPQNSFGEGLHTPKEYTIACDSCSAVNIGPDRLGTGNLGAIGTTATLSNKTDARRPILGQIGWYLKFGSGKLSQLELDKVRSANMDDIAETAMMFVTQAAKYSDRVAFNIPEAFEILYDTIGLFDGAHFQSARARQLLVEAVNVALSSIPGNQVSIHCIEIANGTFVVEWLPYIKGQLTSAGRLRP